MIIHEHDNALIGRIGDDPVAQFTWDIGATGWHINYLRVEQQLHLLPMLVRFRRVWRERGQPALTFRSWRNVDAQRIPLLLNAIQVNGVYRIDNLDMLKPRRRTDAAQAKELNHG